MKSEANREDLISLVQQPKWYQNKAPSMYQVTVLNDDFTPMEFVVGMLQRFFHMDRNKATATMMEAHLTGRAVCGYYSKDVAETRISQVMDFVGNSEHPLVCTMEAV